jgi:hypothetical protein
MCGQKWCFGKGCKAVGIRRVLVPISYGNQADSREQASKRTCTIKTMKYHEELKWGMVRNEVNMNKTVKWSWCKVSVKVNGNLISSTFFTLKQFNEKLFSDTTRSNNRPMTRQRMTWGWMIAKWVKWQWDEASEPGQFRKYPSKGRPIF